MHHHTVVVTFRAVLLLLLWALTPPVAAQCPGLWAEVPALGIPGVNGVVQAAVSWDPDGPAGPQPAHLVVAGRFSLAGGARARNVAAWDGQRWRALGTGVDYDAQALTVHNGELYIGGSFTTAGGVLVRGVAHWDNQAGAWGPVGNGPGSSVYALVSHNGELVAGGQFTGGVARFDGAAWVVIGTPGESPEVRALASFNGELIAGGIFASMNGVAGTRAVARWNPVNGWRPVGAGVYTGYVNALTEHNGELYIGGGFALFTDLVLQNLARWNSLSGGANGSLAGLGSNLSGVVRALASFNGSLHAAGSISFASGAPVREIIRWTGSAWQSVGTGVDGGVFALASYAGRLAVVGSHQEAGGVGALRVALWDPAASSYAALGQGLGSSSFASVNAMIEFGGDLVCAGEFRVGGAVGGTNIARWNGVSWAPMGAGLNGAVRALAVYNGQLYAAGSFTSSGTTGVANIARWTGAAWQAVGSGVSGSVNALAVYNGELVVAGSFSTAGGVSGVGNIARYNAAGNAWGRLAVTGANSTVYALAVIGPDLLAGGTFSSFGTATTGVDGVAAWNGTAWRAHGSLGGFGTRVLAFAQHGGRLYAAGSFQRFAAPALRNVARWDADASAWQPVGMGALDNEVRALAVFDGQLVAGGRFSGHGGAGTLAAVARLDLGVGDGPGVAWQPLGAGLSAGDFATSVSSLVVYPSVGGALHGGGSFFFAGSTVSASLAVWPCNPPPPPPPCEADFDDSGAVGVPDIFVFLAAWFAFEARADFDDSGVVGVPDIFVFLAAWFAGCP